jgi:hypothetical protein
MVFQWFIHSSPHRQLMIDSQLATFERQNPSSGNDWRRIGDAPFLLPVRQHSP